MTKNNGLLYPDPFGDNEGLLDIQCRPATKDDLSQIAILALGLLNKIFADSFGLADQAALDEVQSALRQRLRLDSTWVMREGETVIGMIDLLTSETLRLNGLPIPRVAAAKMGVMEKIRDANLLPLMLHEPGQDEVHQSLVALLPGSRGEGRGTLLLMHGAFWAMAQGKNWMTAWLPSDDPGLAIYERRGYEISQELISETEQGSRKWFLLRHPISAQAHKILRMKSKEKKSSGE
ncbi:MAG: GNAT family N-acetyltransferase [bacterium]|nr:GNAT family N-acetyltransferase [bacterium]